jgi:NAD-dependent epimerase/dehydratase family protein
MKRPRPVAAVRVSFCLGEPSAGMWGFRLWLTLGVGRRSDRRRALIIPYCTVVSTVLSRLTTLTGSQNGRGLSDIRLARNLEWRIPLQPRRRLSTRSPATKRGVIADPDAFIPVEPADGANPSAGYPRATRILVTGGAGFIGSHLVQRLVAEGYQAVTVVDNLRSDDTPPEAASSPTH